MGTDKKRLTEVLLLCTHIMFTWRNKKNVNTFWLKMCLILRLAWSLSLFVDISSQSVSSKNVQIFRVFTTIFFIPARIFMAVVFYFCMVEIMCVCVQNACSPLKEAVFKAKYVVFKFF